MREGCLDHAELWYMVDNVEALSHTVRPDQVRSVIGPPVKGVARVDKATQRENRRALLENNGLYRR